MHDIKSVVKLDPEQALFDITEYAANFQIDSRDAYDTEYYFLMDTRVCGFQALKIPACSKPLVV